MAAKLTDMEITEISLVDEPANEAARVELFKSKKGSVCKDDEKDPNEKEPDGDPDDEGKPKGAKGKKVPMAKVAGAVLAAIDGLSDEIVAKALAGEFADNPDAAEAAAFIIKETVMDLQQLQKALGDAEGRIAELEKRATEAEAAVAAKDEVIKAKDAELDKLAADNQTEDEILKSLPEPIRKRIEEAELAKKKADETIEKMKAEAEEKAAIEKAKGFAVGIAPEVLGPLLARVAKGRSSEADAAELERIFKSVKAVSDRSPLFKSIGSDKPVEGDPEQILVAKAKEIEAANPGLSYAQAYDRALAQNPEVYTAYIAKRRPAAA